MKKVFHLLAFAAVVMVFSACNPLDKTYKQIGDLPTPTGTPQSFNLTLAASDYALLPATNYAQKSLSFKTKNDAAASVPAILASKYPNYANKSAVSVTYNTATVPLLDSVISTNISYTVTNADYTNTLPPNPKFLEFTTAQAIQFLTNKYNYTAATPTQELLLTYLFFESGVTATATTVTDTYLFINGAWIKCYTISPAQFASVGNTFGDFSSSDAPLINTYLSAILKADLAVTTKAKAGDIKYVSFKYFGTKTAQRIQPLVFDGINWTAVASLSFVKTNGTWAADNTITYSLVAADYTTIANIPNASANASAIDNLKQHGNFSISGGTAWADAEINAGIVVVLKAKYPTAVKDQKFVITYSAFNGATISVTKTFQYDGTTFVYKP